MSKRGCFHLACVGTYAHRLDGSRGNETGAGTKKSPDENVRSLSRFIYLHGNGSGLNELNQLVECQPRCLKVVRVRWIRRSTKVTVKESQIPVFEIEVEIVSAICVWLLFVVQPVLRRTRRMGSMRTADNEMVVNAHAKKQHPALLATVRKSAACLRHVRHAVIECRHERNKQQSHDSMAWRRESWIVLRFVVSQSDSKDFVQIPRVIDGSHCIVRYPQSSHRSLPYKDISTMTSSRVLWRHL